MKIKDFALPTLLGIVVGGGPVMAQSGTCLATITSYQVTGSAYGVNSSGTPTWNTNYTIGFDCGSGNFSACTVCTDDSCGSSSCMNGPFSTSNVTQPPSGPNGVVACGAAGNTLNTVLTVGPLLPGTYYQLTMWCSAGTYTNGQAGCGPYNSAGLIATQYFKGTISRPPNC